MNWNKLTSIEQLDQINSLSKPFVIFKHSTRCSISSTALGRIERNWKAQDTDLDWYYLDLLNYRTVSNEIATRYGIEHQSPQILLVKNTQCVYNASHLDIRYEEILQKA